MDIASPVGGGRFQKFVKDLVNAEREPIRQIEARKGRENDRLKLIQEFTGKMKKLPELYRELDSFKKFRELKPDYPDDAHSLLDVVVDKDIAETGEYQIEIVQLAGRYSMISDGFSSPDDEIGIGFFTYYLPSGKSKSIFIGPGSNTLRGLANKINSRQDINCTANILNDGSGSNRPWRVVVSSKKSGFDSDYEFPDFYFLDGDFRLYIDDERSAQNAIVKFNGFEIMSQNNRFEILPGVVFDLENAKEDYEFTLTIREDIAKIAGKVKALVDQLNQVLDFVYKQNKVDAESDTSRTLGGDTTLFTIESRVRNWILTAFPVDMEDDDIIRHLSDVGIRFEKTGQLSFDENKFKKNLQTEFDYVANLFAMEGNFIQRLKEMTEGFLQPEIGVLSSREKGIRHRIKTMDEDIGRKELALQKREQALKRQFAQLEGLMNTMQGQQQYLAQAFGNPGVLPGM